jgi:8-oxo-dGTP pyrophosphatase MutT (NUDIX family)
MVSARAPRSAGQRDVPLLVWRTESFRCWLSAQQQAGNQLEGGRLLWTFRVGPTGRWVLFWAFHARVYVAAEDRVKADEVVLGRPDLATLVAYRRAPVLADSEIVLVREFRSPAVTPDGFVRELPGGSGLTGGDPINQAVAEFTEETGFTIDPTRIRVHAARQPVATLAAHRQHAFSVELTEHEIDQLCADTRVHGLAGDTERTYVEVHRFGELLAGREVDWTTLGILTEILLSSPQ